MRRCLLLTLVALLVACGKSREEHTAQPGSARSRAADPGARWVAVGRGPVRQTVPAVGSFEARQTTLLGPQVGGRVLEILVDVGDRVARDQPLLELDPTFFEIEVRQRQSGVAAARARVDTLKKAIATAESEVERSDATREDAELDLTRMKHLWEKPSGQTPSIPRQRYDRAVYRARQARAAHVSAKLMVEEARSRLREAEAAVSQAEAGLANSRERLEETTIVAPFDGVVTRRLVDTGERVNATPVTHVLEIQETGVLELVFTLPQPLLARVAIGTPVRFRADGVEGGEGEGKVAVIHPDLDPRTRSVRCRVYVDNGTRRLRPGLLARVDVRLECAADAVAVPRAGLRRDDAGWFVTVRKDGRPVRRDVVVGLVGDREAEIRQGLAPGEEVRVER